MPDGGRKARRSRVARGDAVHAHRVRARPRREAQAHAADHLAPAAAGTGRGARAAGAGRAQPRREGAHETGGPWRRKAPGKSKIWRSYAARTLAKKSGAGAAAPGGSKGGRGRGRAGTAPAGRGKGRGRRAKKPAADAPPPNRVVTVRVDGEIQYLQSVGFMTDVDPADVEDPFTLMPGGGDRAAAELIDEAGVLTTRGDHKGARRRYEAILARYPNHYIANYNMGMDRHLAGRPRSAIKYFARAIMAWPENHAAHAGLGRALLGMKQYDAALESLDKALDILPGYPLALEDRAEALKALGRQGRRPRRGRQGP